MLMRQQHIWPQRLLWSYPSLIFCSCFRYREEFLLASLMVAGFILYQVFKQFGIVPVIGVYEGPLAMWGGVVVGQVETKVTEAWWYRIQCYRAGNQISHCTYLCHNLPDKTSPWCLTYPGSWQVPGSWPSPQYWEVMLCFFCFYWLCYPQEDHTISRRTKACLTVWGPGRRLCLSLSVCP